MDWTTLTDDDLAAQINAALTERDRRSRLASIPGQITALATTYKDGGGSATVLQAAIA